MAAGEYSFADLRVAIDRREVVPYFQPIVDLSSGRLWGFEMLARWHHPERGLVPPSAFIPLAESSWLIAPLFESLTEQSFEIAATLPSHLVWSANLTAGQMLDRHLPRWLESTSARFNISLQQLAVELTETGLIQDFDRANAVANELKEAGIRIALDDFGTGYSSLTSLHKLTLDELKIDQSFISSMDERPETRKIAAAVTALGQSLGLTIVAEGVEQKKQADMLHYMGCTMGQGYLYSRPVPSSELKAIVESHFAKPSSPWLASEMATNLEVWPTLRVAQLQAIYDGMNVGLGFVDCEFRFRNVNKWWNDHISNTPVLGKTIGEIAPNMFRRIESHLRRALAGESIYNLELKTTQELRKGHHFVTTSIFPVRDSAGEIIGLCIYLGDITELKSMEETLREFSDQYKTPLETTSTYLLSLDAHGTINWSGFEALGIHDGPMTTEQWLSLMHPDDFEAIREKWEHDRSVPTPHEAEYRMRMPDGTWHWMRARIVPRLSPIGEILGWYGVVQDINDSLQKESGIGLAR